MLNLTKLTPDIQQELDFKTKDLITIAIDSSSDNYTIMSTFWQNGLGITLSPLAFYTLYVFFGWFSLFSLPVFSSVFNYYRYKFQEAEISKSRIINMYLYKDQQNVIIMYRNNKAIKTELNNIRRLTNDEFIKHYNIKNKTVSNYYFPVMINNKINYIKLAIEIPDKRLFSAIFEINIPRPQFNIDKRFEKPITSDYNTYNFVN